MISCLCMQNHYSPAHTRVYGPTYINTQVHCRYHTFHAYQNPFTSYCLTEMKSILLMYLIHCSGVSYQRPRKFSLALSACSCDLHDSVYYLPCSASARSHLIWHTWWCRKFYASVCVSFFFPCQMWKFRYLISSFFVQIFVFFFLSSLLFI